MLYSRKHVGPYLFCSSLIFLFSFFSFFPFFPFFLLFFFEPKFLIMVGRGLRKKIRTRSLVRAARVLLGFCSGLTSSPPYYTTIPTLWLTLMKCIQIGGREGQKGKCGTRMAPERKFELSLKRRGRNIGYGVHISIDICIRVW